MESHQSEKMMEITVISAEGLFVNRKRSTKKKTVSVTVKTDSLNSRSTGAAAVTEGGSAWNESLVMALPAAARFVTVEVRSDGKVVGSVDIPVSEFCGGYLPENYLSFLSYRLRSVDGGRSGIVNLSAKVTRGAGSGGCCRDSWSSPWMGIPARDSKGSGRIVMGIPVSQGRY